jgi:hypothetical protein
MTNLNNLIKQRQGEVETKSQHAEWGGWRIVSDMLDKPDEDGIYPTSECYERLHDFVVEQKIEAARQILLDVLAGLPGDVDLSSHNFKCKEDVLEWDIPREIYEYAKDDGHNTVLQTVRAQIEGLLSAIDTNSQDS